MRNARPLSLSVFLVALMAVPPCASAEPRRDQGKPRDRFQLSAYSETYAALFRRALLPGANGSLVSTGTVSPFYESLGLRAVELDTALGDDSLDLELAVWGSTLFGARANEPLLTGDVQIANARIHRGPWALRLGRQQVAGGAARFARFDGAELGATLGAGIEARAYGGLTVLPRWNELPQYQHLGNAADSLLRDSATLDSAQRQQYWLVGGRLGWSANERRLGLSFHEQREPGGLARRNLGLDGRAGLVSWISVGGGAVMDLDRARLADARLWLDASPSRATELSLEYLHTEPALFLSNQSVLSVFGSAAYDEAGGYASVRASPALTLSAAGFAQFYAGDRPGARTELAAKWFADQAQRTFLRLGYARVLAPNNGYHSLRSSLSRRLATHFRGTLEAYAYLYDEPIRGYRASTVYAGTLSFEPVSPLTVLWGASLSHSPYANLDAQTELRVSYALDLSTRRGSR